jgi:PAS domain S-box-containing protein
MNDGSPALGVFASSATQTPAEKLFRAVIEGAPNGIIVVDTRGVMVLVNRETEQLFGYARTELLGRSVEMLVPHRFRQGHPDYREYFTRNPQRRAMGAGRDLFGVRKDGREIPIEIGLNPVEGEDGLYVKVSVVDIGPRKRAEARFRVAVEASPHGVLMVDTVGRVVLVNRELERLFGYKREELLGHPVEMLVPIHARTHHPSLRSAFHVNPQSRAMGAGRDLFGRRKDGTEIPLEIGLNPIETDEGTFVLASVVDISPRKHAEEELRRSNEELERFAYVASHDLQEPLRTVTSYMQLLSRRYRNSLDGEAGEFIDFAVNGAKRMQNLIEDLLTFSRVGTRGGVMMPTDAGAVFDAAVLSLQAAAKESHASITHDPLPSVLADAGQLEQLLTNLLGNALKFHGNEPSHVHVSARREGRHWCFSIRDNGIGIDSQFLDRIFVIFQRLHGREEYAGTGIGLAICKKIVERHGGKIWVDSAPGLGATFFFTLPSVPE